MNVGDLVHYIKNPPIRATDCGIFQRCFGLIVEIRADSNEAVIMTDGQVCTIDLDAIEVASANSWFIKRAR